MPRTTIENLLPVLSPGRHRNPRRGACFMEYASYLAGVRWSDHPSCTHPSIAALARLVNDVSSDETRSRLTVLIPSVVGLVGYDQRVPLVVAAIAGSAALPVCSEDRQRVLATGLLRCERLLAAYDDPVCNRTAVRARDALDSTPSAEAWAHAFETPDVLDRPRPISAGDETLLRLAVIGLAEACIDDRGDRLVRLLRAAIYETQQLLMPELAATPPAPSPTVTPAGSELDSLVGLDSRREGATTCQVKTSLE